METELLLVAVFYGNAELQNLCLGNYSERVLLLEPISPKHNLPKERKILFLKWK